MGRDVSLQRGGSRGFWKRKKRKRLLESARKYDRLPQTEKDEKTSEKRGQSLGAQRDEEYQRTIRITYPLEKVTDDRMWGGLKRTWLPIGKLDL